MEELTRLDSEGLEIMRVNTVSALQKYMTEKGASQSAVARACNLSAPVISQFLKGHYEGDVAKVTKQIQDFLVGEEEREGVFTSSQFVRTAQAQDVLRVCSMAHTYGFMGLVQARAGLGKTTTIKEYVAHKSNSRLITASTFNCSKWAVADLLLSALRVKTTYTTLSKAVEQIVQKCGTGALIIIDEAQHLPKETLEGLRYIHDDAHVAIVLCGTIAISEQMTGRKGFNFEQLASRIGCRRTLSETVSREDVKKILNQAIPGAAPDVVDYCLAKANGPGAYRTMMRYIQVAKGRADAHPDGDGGVPLKHFRAAEEILMV